jgi:hypothetical protein
MRALVPLLMAAWLAFTVSAPAAEAATPSEAFTAGTAAFAQEDYLRALAHFQEARNSGSDGPAIHYNIAVCHYRLGEYRNAAAAFALIAERYPEARGLAQYNLGLIAQKQGDEAEAAGFFRQALSNSQDEKVRFLARQQLGLETPVSPAPPGRQWFTLIDGRVGHDDNVLLLAEEITLPNGQSAESSFTEFWALVSGPLSAESGFRFDGSAYAVRYPDASIFDQTVLRLGTVYEWRWGSWRAEAGPHISHSTLDGDTFERRIGAGVRFRRGISSRTTLGFRYVHDEIEEGEERFVAFEGSRDWLEVRLDHNVAHGRLTAAYAFESNDRFGATVSPDRNKLSLRYQHFFDQRWLADIQISLRESRFDQLAEPRDEDLSEVSFALTRILPRGWQLSGVLSHSDNDANVETVIYQRNRTSFGFTKQF